MASASATSGSGGPLVIQAEEQMALGRKEAAKWSMFSGSEKWENAARHFKSAGNFYKAAMKWEESYKAYMEARGAFVKIGESIEELQMMREAAQVLTHQDPKLAATMLETELVPRLVEAGKLDEVAKMHRTIAETVKDDDLDLCMEHYRKAADMFLSAGSKSDMVKCKLKIAEMAANQEEYDEAISMFVEAAEVRLEKDLTRLSARDHLLDAGICVLAKDDLVHCKESLERWCGMDYTFEDSREGRLFATLIKAAEEKKVEDFADAVFDFDRIKKLTPWRTKILLRVKDVVGGEGDDVAEDLS